MQEFLDCVVGDACLLRKQAHDLDEFLLLAELNDRAGFRENESDDVLRRRDLRLRGHGRYRSGSRFRLCGSLLRLWRWSSSR